MDILATIKREEKKLEEQLGKLQHQLNGVRAAAKALGDSASRGVTTVKKRVLSAAGRAPRSVGRRSGRRRRRQWDRDLAEDSLFSLNLSLSAQECNRPF